MLLVVVGAGCGGGEVMGGMVAELDVDLGAAKGLAGDSPNHVVGDNPFCLFGCKDES